MSTPRSQSLLCEIDLGLLEGAWFKETAFTSSRFEGLLRHSNGCEKLSTSSRPIQGYSLANIYTFLSHRSLCPEEKAPQSEAEESSANNHISSRDPTRGENTFRSQVGDMLGLTSAPNTEAREEEEDTMLEMS